MTFEYSFLIIKDNRWQQVTSIVQLQKFVQKSVKCHFQNKIKTKVSHKKGQSILATRANFVSNTSTRTYEKQNQSKKLTLNNND